MRLQHKFGRVISKTSLELPDLPNVITATKVFFQEATDAMHWKDCFSEIKNKKSLLLWRYLRALRSSRPLR